MIEGFIDSEDFLIILSNTWSERIMKKKYNFWYNYDDWERL